MEKSVNVLNEVNPVKTADRGDAGDRTVQVILRENKFVERRKNIISQQRKTHPHNTLFGILGGLVLGLMISFGFLFYFFSHFRLFYFFI